MHNQPGLEFSTEHLPLNLRHGVLRTQPHGSPCAPRAHRRVWRLWRVAGMMLAMLGIALVPTLLFCGALAVSALAVEYTGVTRDTFPVFNDPPMLSADQAERRRLVISRMAVIGVAHGASAKAYPIAVMGIHELGNDTIDGIPIAISW